MQRPNDRSRTGIRHRMAIAVAVGALALTVVSVAGAGESVIGTIPVGRQPLSIAVNPLSHMVYVADHYSDDVRMIDGASDSAVATVPMPPYWGVPMPIAVVVDSLDATPKAFVANWWSATVSVIGEASRSVIGTMTVGSAHASGPRALALDPTGATSKLYVARFGDADVAVYDADTFGFITTVPVGVRPRALGVFAAPGHHRVFVANRDSGTVNIIDGDTDSVIASLPTGGYPRAIAVDPNTAYAYVTNTTSDTVSVISSGDVIAATVPVGSRPRGLAIDTAGRRVFVANSNSGDVSVIDQDTNLVVATVTVEASPHAIAFDPVARKAYVTNIATTTVSVIDSTLTVQSVQVSSPPYAIVADPANTPRKVYVTLSVLTSSTLPGTVTVIDEPAGSWRTAYPVAPAGAPTGPVQVMVTPLPGNATSCASPTIVGTALDLRSPYISSMASVLYRYDDETAWRRASFSGTSSVTWSAGDGTTLPVGPHRIVVLAVDERSTVMATSEWGTGVDCGWVGPQAEYRFDVDPDTDAASPTVTSVQVTPAAGPAGTTFALEAVAGDADSGASLIATAAYSLDGAGWAPMAAADGAFDQATESVAATLGPFGSAGLHRVRVRAWDAAGNVSDATATAFAVFDRRAGAVMGAGRFGPGPISGLPVLRVRARYRPAGVLGARVTLLAEGRSLEATTADWLTVSGGLAVLNGRGRCGDGDAVGYTIWVRDRYRGRVRRTALVRARITRVPDGMVLYDSQPGAALDAEPTGRLRRGRIRVSEPVHLAPMFPLSTF